MSRPFLLAMATLAACVAGASAQEAMRVPFLEAVSPPEESREDNPFEDRIETDRDAFTPTPKLIGPGRFAVESAYSFIDNRTVKETHSYPEFLARFGLTKRVELRLGWNYEVGGERNSVSGSAATEVSSRPPELDAGGMEEALSLVRESNLTYGAKISLNEQSGWLPESTVILVGQTPTGGTETTTQFVGTYVVGWELPNRWKLDAAVRYATAGSEDDRYRIWAPSVVLRVPVGERTTVHGEYFGFLLRGQEGGNTNRHFLSAGASYLITPDLEVGVRGGPGLNDQSAFWFINAGFGWRF